MGECDMWSLGVCAYVLLCGYAPFAGETRDAVAKLVSKGEFEFHEASWSEVSAEAKDFVSALLRLRPSERMTAKEVLDHPWIKNTPDRQLINMKDHLRLYQAKRRWKRGIGA